jgi:hypothetical protein
MDRDFTVAQYKSLLDALISGEYEFQTFMEFLLEPGDRVVILRHDVDSWPVNALQMARAEAKTGAKATYYFRRSPLSYDERVLKGIIELGHEIGYHYEDLAACNGNMEIAIKRFENNLQFYRQYYPIQTIAMHGRPLSRWDSKDLWKQYDYHEFGLIGEPYLDIDFNTMMYLTDTGNCWDGDKYSVRDHVRSPYNFTIHSTLDLINHIKRGVLPEQIMLNIHPARWNDNFFKWWIRYYVLTLPKYQAKKFLKQRRNRAL